MSERPKLTEISISGIGVIEKSSLEFGPGLTVITGETGARSEEHTSELQSH